MSELSSQELSLRCCLEISVEQSLSAVWAWIGEGREREEEGEGV